MKRSPLGVSTDSHRPRFSVSQVSTLAASFADDVRIYSAAGLDGIGIWELKLGDGPDEENLELLEASGLDRATAVPATPSILPLPLLPGPSDPRERIDALAGSLHRLAPFAPTVLCLTGPGDRATVVDGLRELAAEAESVGVQLALEPFQREGLEDWGIASTLSDAVDLIEDAGGSPALGIQFDVWHLWNTPELEDEIERHIGRIAGVHVSDWRDPTRGWADRVLPGDGVAGVSAILGKLERAGWDGLYDLEIFSDNGAFGTTHPDSLWDVDPQDLVRRGRESFMQSWQDRRVAA